MTVKQNDLKDINFERVTVVDDDPFFLKFIADKLSQLSIHNHELFSDPANATNFLINQNFNTELLLLDLQMPKIDGISFLKILGEKGFKGQIIIISGFEQKVLDLAGQIAQKHNLSIVGQLHKPFTLDELRELSIKAKQQIVESNSDTANKTTKQFDANSYDITEKQLITMIQPQIRLSDEKIVGYEVLSRLAGEHQQLIMPDQFIDEFEKNGRMPEFNQVLLKNVFEKIPPNSSETISINLSVKNLVDQNIVDQLSDYITQYQLNAGNITIEITESCIVEDLLKTQEMLTRIRLLGVNLSIDDYGAGYSTMKQLNDFPFQELKIDRAYVENCHINKQNQVLIKSTIEMAKSLNMITVAEGVETKEELDVVKQLGVDIVQGFYYSRPYIWS